METLSWTNINAAALQVGDFVRMGERAIRVDAIREGRLVGFGQTLRLDLEEGYGVWEVSPTFPVSAIAGDMYCQSCGDQDAGHEIGCPQEAVGRDYDRAVLA